MLKCEDLVWKPQPFLQSFLFYFMVYWCHYKMDSCPAIPKQSFLFAMVLFFTLCGFGVWSCVSQGVCFLKKQCIAKMCCCFSRCAFPFSNYELFQVITSKSVPLISVTSDTPETASCHFAVYICKRNKTCQSWRRTQAHMQTLTGVSHRRCK